ncbi:hypothetical protein H6G51_17870 [Limnothrix sp. FACHB-708]|nr:MULTISPECIES: hypothetical protein [unclassified Limnothrix]MBD2555155.1 hypothetical protein [Limnothrix sp. FACHB-708]MBD2592581.1 hypothetical protein [Limnothrix sp. FACHB-406]
MRPVLGRIGANRSPRDQGFGKMHRHSGRSGGFGWPPPADRQTGMMECIG